jgi:hypothetical protein
MTYTIERVHSCVAELGQAMYRLTYESDYVPELHVWRHVLVHEEKLYPLAPDTQGFHAAAHRQPRCSVPERYDPRLGYSEAVTY